MSDPRSRGRGPRPQDFGSRPLGRMPDFAGGRAGMGRGPSPGSRPLGSAPVRTSSGSLAPLAAGGLGAAIAAGQGAAGAAGAAAAAAGAGGRGAGPDHREVRYADGVLAMINVLRLLTLGGPRTWDANMHKQLGMQAAPRPSPGVAGREVNLMVNHFALSIRPGSSMAVYSVHISRSNEEQQQHAADGGKQQWPRGLAKRALAQLAADAGWPGIWLLLGSDRLAAARAFLPTNAPTEATVTLQPQRRQQQQGSEAAAGGSNSSGSSETFKVRLSYLGSQDINALRSTAAADAAADSGSSGAGLLDGIALLEALLMAAALQQTPKQQQQQSPAAASSAPVPVPGAAAAAVSATPAAIGSAPVGSAGTGLMGLAGGVSAGTPGSQQQLLGMALPGLAGMGPALGGSAGSPAAGSGLLAASIASQAAVGGAASMPGGTAAAALPAAAGSSLSSSLAGGGSSSTAISAALAGVPRVQVGRTVFLHAPGNAELHAPLGGGLEGWLGFRQRLAATQSGPAVVVDLTAAPFLEPGPLLSSLPALLGRPAALLPPGAAAAAAGNNVAAAGLEDGQGGEGAMAAPAAAAAASALAALSPAEHWRLQQQLKGVKVEVALPGGAARLCTVAGLSAGAASATSFSLRSSCAAGEAGSSVSVQQYFKAVHGLQLAAPQLPCIEVASSSSEGEGSSSSSQHIWYPLELCSLPPGQRYAPPLDQPQLAALARLGAKKATDRKAWLEALTAPLAAASSSSPLPVPGAAAEPGSASGNGIGSSDSNALSGTGVEVSGLLGIVRGRVLPAPHLAYQQPECCYPGSQGQWNVKSCKLPGASRIASWALVVLLPQGQADVEGPSGVVPFVADLRDSLRSMGLECEVPPIVYEQPGLSVLQHLRAGCEAAQKQFNASPELLLVMLPSRSAALYSEVKLASDAALGLPSQVMVAPTAGVGRGAAPRGRLQYCANLGLKINAKLGGVNMRLAGNPDQVIPVVGGRPFILFGLALAAPTASAPPGTPAAAAVVASRDRSLGRYSSRVLLQPWQPQQQQQQHATMQLDTSSSEAASSRTAAAGDSQQQQPGASPYVIQGLRGAAKELLIDFYRQNGGRKPEALLCYRATSEEGQGQQLMAAEYEALRAACFELEEGYCPPVTYVTVSRAHSTRLFPADRDNQDKSGNCLPGTVVDSGICHPTQFDFFLNSHAGLQGHNKPAHYHVLVDENGFSSDGLQLLTYWLCYLYCRCTRSVSVVPPAYYAQLAAARGRLLASSKDSMGNGGSPAAGEADGADAVDEAAELLDFDVRVNARLGGSMYYV